MRGAKANQADDVRLTSPVGGATSPLWRPTPRAAVADARRRTEAWLTGRMLSRLVRALARGRAMALLALLAAVAAVAAIAAAARRG